MKHFFYNDSQWYAYFRYHVQCCNMTLNRTYETASLRWWQAQISSIHPLHTYQLSQDYSICIIFGKIWLNHCLQKKALWTKKILVLPKFERSIQTLQHWQQKVALWCYQYHTCFAFLSAPSCTALHQDFSEQKWGGRPAWERRPSTTNTSIHCNLLYAIHF